MKNCLFLLALLSSIVTCGRQPVQAIEPITTTVVLSALGGYLFGEVINVGSEVVIGGTPSGKASEWLLSKPRLEDIQQKLDSLAARDAANKEMIQAIRGELRDKMSRTEVQAVLMKALRKVDKDLAKLADRVTGIEAENIRLRDKITSLEYRLEQQSQKQNLRSNLIEGRVVVVEGKLSEHEDRLKRLENAVAALGVRGYGLYFTSRYDLSIKEFDNAIEKDPGNPAYHYGKALAHRRKKEMKEAEKCVRMGANAERMRRTPSWYVTVMERVQGPDREWFSLQRSRSLRDAGPIR